MSTVMVKSVNIVIDESRGCGFASVTFETNYGYYGKGIFDLDGFRVFRDDDVCHESIKLKNGDRQAVRKKAQEAFKFILENANSLFR